MLGLNYQQRLQLNQTLYYLYKVSFNFVFLYAIWYRFETQYLSVFALGVIYAVARFFITLLELPTGALADLLGRKYTLAVGMLIEGLSWVMLGAWPSANMVLLAYMINSVGTALSSGSDSALLFDSLKELKQEDAFTKVTSNANLLMRFSFIGSAIIGGYLYSYNQGLPYILTGMAMMGAGIIASFSQEPRLDSEKFTLVNYMRQTKAGIRELTKSPLIKLFSLFYIINGGITWYYVYFLHTVLFTETFATDITRGWMLGGTSLIGGLLIAAMARLVAATDHKKIVGIFFVTTLMSTLPALLFNQVVLVVAGVTLYSLAIARFSFLDQVANDYFDSKYRATALSALSMGVSLVFIIWSVAGGWILDRWNVPMLLTLMGSFFALTTTLVTWKIIRLVK